MSTTARNAIGSLLRGGGARGSRHAVSVSDLEQQAVDDVEPAVHPERAKRRLDKGLLIASLVIAGGLVLIVWGMISAVTGDEGVDRPDEIESVFPVENAAQVLQQSNVRVDLESGFEAELEIDGILLPTSRLGEIEAEPGQQVNLPPTAVYDAGNAVISFQPVEGAPIEELTEGRHQARVIFWKVEDGRDYARSYTWTFDVV